MATELFTTHKATVPVKTRPLSQSPASESATSGQLSIGSGSFWRWLPVDSPSLSRERVCGGLGFTLARIVTAGRSACRIIVRCWMCGVAQSPWGRRVSWFLTWIRNSRCNILDAVKWGMDESLWAVLRIIQTTDHVYLSPKFGCHC